MYAVDATHPAISKMSILFPSVLFLKICKILKTLSINTIQLIHLKLYKIQNLRSFLRLANLKNMKKIFQISYFITWGKFFDFMRLKSELIYMYSSHDFHLKLNCIKKINRERWTKRCLGKSICFNEIQLNILSQYNEYRFGRKQKAILGILEIKKLIFNGLKQVWICILELFSSIRF